jgi:hypothetical protein
MFCNLGFMKRLRYQVWKFPPSWKSVLPLGVFDFHVEALLSKVRRNIQHFDDHPALHQFPAQRKQNQTFRALANELEALPEVVTPWETSDEDRIWWLVNSLVFDGAWDSVFCPECQNSWTFSDCAIEDWSVGEDLAAEGGRLLMCPRHHLLCRSREWNS